MTDADSPNTSCMLIDLEGGGGSYGFQWNPDKIDRKVHVPWNQLRVAGREQPIQQFGCGEAETYHIEFDISRMDRGDSFVKQTVDKLFELKKPTVGGFVKRPPRCQFIVGAAIKVVVIVIEIDAKYGPLYHPTSLLPYGARVKMTLREVK